MAFPVVEARSTGSQTGGTPTTVNLPAGIADGDLVVLCYGNSFTGAFSLPSPWVILGQIQADKGLGSADFRGMVAYLIASGGETTVVVTGGADHRHWTTYRISGHGGASVPPEIAIVDLGNQQNSTNPPNLNPTGGAKDFLWICGATRPRQQIPSAPPSSYTNLLTAFTTLNPNMETHSAERLLNADSENPGDFSIVGDSGVVAWTVAVSPPPPGTAALAGTVTDDTEADIRAGGSDITLTLTDDTWVTSGGTFDAQRQAIIDGLVSAQVESTGWNTQLRPGIPVGNVIRNSDTLVTITLPGDGAYEITADEIVEATIPAAALTLAAVIVATPTFTVTNLPEAPGGPVLPSFWFG